MLRWRVKPVCMCYMLYALVIIGDLAKLDRDPGQIAQDIGQGRYTPPSGVKRWGVRVTYAIRDMR